MSTSTETALLVAPLAAAGIALINCGLGRSRNAAHALLSALCAAAIGALAYVVTGMFGAALAALIPLGAGLERWRLRSICVSTVVLALVAYPLFGRLHGDGFIDQGGAGSIHVLGGLTALAVAWLLGPRHGKPMAIPGHSVVFVLFGCFVAATGFAGINVAGSGSVKAAGINTILMACAAALTAAGITRIRFGSPDASLTANGWMGGLVASSAGCAFMPPGAAALTGLIAGALVTFSVEVLELRLEVDDPGGSISVHGVAGVWGLLATGLFAHTFQVQVVGVATLVGCIFPLTWGLNALMNRVIPMRVPPEGERLGLDLFELGAGAYPDFVTHTDDFTR